MIQDNVCPVSSMAEDKTESDFQKKKEKRAVLIQRMAAVAGYITLPVGLFYMDHPMLLTAMAACHAFGAFAVSLLSALDPDDPFPSTSSANWEQSPTAGFGRAYLAAGILSLSVAAGMELTADKRISHSMANQISQSQPSGATPLSKGKQCRMGVPYHYFPFDWMYDGVEGPSAVVTVEDTKLSYAKDGASVLSGTMDVSGWRINCITGTPKVLRGQISFKQTTLSNGMSRFEAK
ncbi:MAG: hypothetical protein WC612_02085 [Bdellovibrionales bacterium]|jgi:hypothetical protein